MSALQFLRNDFSPSKLGAFSGLSKKKKKRRRKELGAFNSIPRISVDLMASLWQGNGQLQLMAFEQEELWGRANEQIPWHEKLEGEEAIQNRVHE